MTEPLNFEGLTGYRELRASVALFEHRRDVVTVSGPDASTYLQGQCSQDVLSLEIGSSAESLVLTPQGKIDGYLRILRVSETDYVLDMDEGFGEAVRARLERFRLRVAVDIEATTWTCLGIRGPETAAMVASISRSHEGYYLHPVSWPGFSGADLLVAPWSEDGWAKMTTEATRCTPQAWEAARIEAGVPRMGAEITPSTIPAEVDLVERTVSFTKGCFTGQELVARLDARGSNVARRLRGITFDPVAGDRRGGSPGDSGAGLPIHELLDPSPTVYTVDGAHELGHLTSAAWSPTSRSTVGLGVLHRRLVPPESVLVIGRTPDGEARLAATAAALPLVS